MSRFALHRSIALLAATAALWTAQGCGMQPVASGAAMASGGASVQGLSRKKAWLEGAVFYGVVPPLFGGEPFKAVTAKLDDLKAQGVDAIWLSPIYETDDQSGISYSVTDYKAIRPDFGTQEDFKRLVAESHRRGIRVILDFVPNHTSSGHPYFKDAEAKGPKSPYWNYYVRDKSGTAQHYFDWGTLMNLNYDHAGVQAMITEACTYWVRDMDVDGFRCDAAWGVKDRTPGFWPKLNKTLNAIKPDVFMLAEASARDPYYVTHGFDAAYDWTKELGHWSWEHVFETPASAGDKLRKALSGKETPPDQIVRFLNNNDTGSRFITRYGLDTQRVGAVLMHTLPGIPLVYNGDEVGAEFEPYADPAPLSWADPHGLKPLYKKLAELKGTLPALRKGNFAELKVDKLPGVYAFTREAGDKQAVLVALNFGKAAKVVLDVPASLRAGHLTDALTGQEVPTNPGRTTITLTMPKSSAFVLVPSARDD